jgi:hypothetical protein
MVTSPISTTANLDAPRSKACEGRRIVVVRRPNDSFDRDHYTIHLLIEQWRQWGFAVEVSDHVGAGTGRETVVIPHLDTTRTPVEYETSFARCAVVVNRRVIDISKRRVSQNLVTDPANYDGPVMVKTDRNFGGRPELERFNATGRIAQMALILARRLPWTLTGMIGQYRIFDRASMVPRMVWRNPLLVVEKFLPERQDGMYCLRQYTFFGEAERNTLAFSPEPIVKARNIVRREVLSGPAPGLREMRTALGFDYGKFDYVLHNGRTVVLDTNRTPTYNPASLARSSTRFEKVFC